MMRLKVNVARVEYMRNAYNYLLENLKEDIDIGVDGSILEWIL
jgi:hypothetical protein